MSFDALLFDNGVDENAPIGSIVGGRRICSCKTGTSLHKETKFMGIQGRVRNITELAKLAGVSPGTVSRALADSKLIAKRTREKIQSLASEHNFRPNIMARNLRIRRAGAIGVLVPTSDREQACAADRLAMLGDLADALAGQGYDLLLRRLAANDGASVDRLIESGRVDGVIVLGQCDRASANDNATGQQRPLIVWEPNDKQSAADIVTQVLQSNDRFVANEAASVETRPTVDA